MPTNTTSTELIDQSFHPELQKYISQIISEFKHIENERIRALEEIGDYMLKSYQDHGKVNMLMVCTHNSRRSHMAQIWLLAAGYYYGLENLFTFSGGTETTAANIRAMEALQRAGFSVTKGEIEEKNQRYLVSPGSHYPVSTVFSKVYDDPVNPSKAFAAVMVCSDADEACPFIPGTKQRFSLPFVDPKHADHSHEEQRAYDKASLLIAREMCYIACYIKTKIR